MADAAFNTLAPSFQLLLDGSAAPIDLAVNVIGIRVTEDLTRPSRFTINVSDVGRVWTKSNKFKSGREVEVKLGYVSKVESVIKAEVHSWEVDLAVDGPARLVVQGYDRLHRFTRGPKTRTFLNETDSDIIKKIAQEHGMSVEADDSQALRPFVLQNNVPDFDFILERAALCGFEVRVQAKKLFFKKPAVTRQPVTKLTWGENIGRIAHEINTFDQAPKIEARAWDPIKQKLLTAPAKVGDELSKMGGQTVGAKLAKDRFGDVQQYVLSTATSLKEVEAEVKAEFNRRAGDFVRIECRVDGDPRIRAGTIVEIEKAGKRLDGVYYVTWVEHSFFTDAGYSTEFRGRRYSMDKGSGAPKDVTPKGLVSAIDGATRAVNAITEGVEKARACFQAAKGAVEKANKTLQDAQRALNNTIAAVKTAVEAVESAVENAKEIAEAAFKEAKAFVDIAKNALDDAKSFLLKAADTVGAPPEFKKALESAFKAADSAVNTAKDGLALAENFVGEGGKLLEKAESIWEKIKEKLGSGGGQEPIAVGAKISPPKIGIIASSESDEKEWFARLEKIGLDALKPGDVLLEKAYGDAANPVVLSQRSLIADKASAFTSHALLYVGDGQVARMAADGFKLESLQALGENGSIKRVVVYRTSDSAQANSAIAVAQWLGEQSPKYSSGHCFALSARNYAWSAKAKTQAADIASRKNPPAEMMCSEFVAFCYQGLPEALITVDAKRLSPFELEDWLNDHDAFAFAGALGQAELSGETPSIEELKTRSQGLQEAGADAKAALETAKSAVALCATSVSKASANDAAGADAVTAQADMKAQEAKEEGEAATGSAQDANTSGESRDKAEAEMKSASAEPEPSSDEDAPAEETEAIGDEDAQPADETEATGDEGAQPADETEAVSDEDAQPADETEAVDDEDAQPADETEAVGDEDAQPPDETEDAQPVDETEVVGDEDAQPADEVQADSADDTESAEEAPTTEEEGEPSAAADSKGNEEEAQAPDAAPAEQNLGAPSTPELPVEAAKSDETPVAELDVPAGIDAPGSKAAEDAAPPTIDEAAADDRKGLLEQVADAKPSDAKPSVSAESKGVGAAEVAGAVVGGVAAAGVVASVAAGLSSSKAGAGKGASAAESLGDAAGSSAKKASNVAAAAPDIEGAAKAAAQAGSVDLSADTVKKNGGLELEDLPAAGNVADGKKAAEGAKKKASSAQEAAKDPKKGALPKVGLQDVSDARSAVTKAKTDASRLQWQAENAGEIVKGAVTGDAMSEARKLQSEASSAQYMAENAGDIATGTVKNEVLGEVRRVQSDVSSAQHMAENAGDIAKGTATEAVDSELGLRHLKQDATQAQYMAENAGATAKGHVENAVTSEVRGAQLDAQNELRNVKYAADEPGRMVADARAAEMDATSRVNRIASGDLTEAQRTGGDLKEMKEAFGADDLDLELELPDLPDKDGNA